MLCWGVISDHRGYAESRALAHLTTRFLGLRVTSPVIPEHSVRRVGMKGRPERGYHVGASPSAWDAGGQRGKPSRQKRRLRPSLKD